MRRNVPGTAVVRRGQTSPAVLSPWSLFDEMQRRMDEIFARPFGSLWSDRWGFDHMEPAVDVYETDDSVIAFAALPGYAPDAIRVEATTDTLSIQGERAQLFDTEKATAHRVSGLTGASQFSVSYTLPVEIQPDKVKASFTHGILKVEMPKAEHARPRGVKVTVEKGS